MKESNIKKQSQDCAFWIGVVENFIKENTNAKPKIIWYNNGITVEIIFNSAVIYGTTIDYLRSFCKKNKIKYNFELVSDRVYKVIFYD